ncbi:MAG: C4-type zinc ribbon domain-containing protein [Armatimonadota bacterium]
MHNLWKICKLQKIDLELDDKVEQVNALDSGEKRKKQIEAAVEKTDAFKNHIEVLRKQAKEYEAEIQSKEEQIKNIDKQLYSGRNTNSKELMSWQQEVDYIKSQKKQIEDKMLKSMEEAESFEGKVKVAEELIEKAKKEHEETVKKYNEELGKFNENIAQIQDRRKVVLEGIEEEELQKYEQMRSRKGGLAVVKIEGDCCGGCFINLPKNIIDKAKERSIVYCGNCGRILYTE